MLQKRELLGNVLEHDRRVGFKCPNGRAGFARIRDLYVCYYYSMKRCATLHMTEMLNLNIFTYFTYFHFYLSELARVKTLILCSVGEYVWKQAVIYC